MHLVTLVVAGQHVHHDVHAGTESIFALILVGRNGRQGRIAHVVHGPGAGEVIGRDHDRRHAVCGNGGGIAGLVRALSRLHPERRIRIATGKLVEQEEGARQNVPARHGFERRDVEAAEDLLQPLAVRRRLCFAKGMLGLVARVEEHGAAGAPMRLMVSWLGMGADALTGQ